MDDNLMKKQEGRFAGRVLGQSFPVLFQVVDLGTVVATGVL